jgi:hypothetical protein
MTGEQGCCTLTYAVVRRHSMNVAMYKRREENAIQRNVQEKGMPSNAIFKRRECYPTQCAREGNAIQRNVQEKGMLSNKVAQRENILGNQTKGSTPNAVRCITRMVMVWLLGGMVATDD